MGLINLQTNLKSLTYGGNGPYVKKNINKPPSDNRFALEVTKRIDDISRITQMLADKPGIIYELHNTLLRAPILQHKIADEKNKVVPSPISILKEAKLAGMDTLYTIGSTLAQVAVNGTGTHFVKGFGKGITPYISNTNVNGLSLAGTTLSIDNTAQIKKSELVRVDAKGALQPARKSQSVVYSPYFSEGTETNLGQTNQYDITKNKDYGQSYFGIPDPNTYIEKKKEIKTSNGNITKESRVRLGDQGAGRGTSDAKKQAVAKNQYWFASDPNSIDGNSIDKINALPAHIGKYLVGDGSITQQTLKGGQTLGRDFVKFRFHVLTPEIERVLYFRAFLTSFSDNYNGSWNDVKYLGRGETFYTYAGFQRKISLSFKIAAATREELIPIYEKLNYLAGSTAPTYSKNSQFMRGTMSKMTIGDYVTDLTGIINSVTYAWTSEYPWEIAVNEPEAGGDKLMKELPMVLDCNIEFTPIHSFTPTADAHDYISVNIDEDMRKAFFNKDFLETDKGEVNYSNDIAPTTNTPK